MQSEPPERGMLRVFKATGEEVLAINFAEFVEMLSEQPARAVDLKRHLRPLCGQPRFRQRLLLPDGQMLWDDYILHGPTDIQLILLPFAECSLEQVRQLHENARDNNVKAMECLLQQPLNPDLQMRARPALHVACEYGCVEAAHLLLEANADKEKGNQLGDTPILVASLKGHLQMVRILLQSKANTETANQIGDTPILAASFMGHLEIVRMLLEANADKEKTNRIGNTPTLNATRKGHLEIVRILLAAKADKDKADQYGSTPISVASENGHREIVRILLEAKADQENANQEGETPMSQEGHMEAIQPP